MGLFSEKLQVDGSLESENKKWVISGIQLRAPLKPVNTSPVRKERDEEGEECSTPTYEEARIPTTLTCPPPPRKRKASSRCKYSGVMEFFNPPDLETVFIRHVERATS